MGKLAGPFIGWGQWAPCAANWPGHATERYTGPWNAKTKTPILLINNTYDPATGYPGAQHAERLLGNAVLLTVAGYGHPFGLPSRCADTWRVRYLVHLVTPAAGDGLREPSARSRNTCQGIRHFRHPGMARRSQAPNPGKRSPGPRIA